MSLVILLFFSCKPTQIITERVVETRTDTVTVVEIQKTAPIVDSVIIVQTITEEKPIYFEDKNWTIKLTKNNDILTAEIKHLTDSIEHIYRETKINSIKNEFSSSKNVTKNDNQKTLYIIPFLIISLVFLLFVVFLRK